MALKFLSKLLAIIGSFFSGLFNAAEKTWNKLEPEIRAAMLQASDVVAIVNENVDQTPQFVLEIVQQKYPAFTLDQIHEAIKKGSQGLSIGAQVLDNDILSNIQLLQKYLEGLEGSTWANISQTLMKGMAVFMAPKGTKFAVISSLAEFVYQRFIKKRE